MEWILLGIIAVIVVWVIAIYNGLVRLRQNRENSFADIDVQLRMRHDLIPNLIATVKGYATHERELMEKLTTARANAMNATGTAGRAAAEGAVSGLLAQVLAVAENYPDLKANQNFLQLQTELSDIENKIAAARRYFNNATSEYNTAREQFPAVLFASSMGFGKQEFFALDEAERATMKAPPTVSFN